jgi:hypothetical protein
MLGCCVMCRNILLPVASMQSKIARVSQSKPWAFGPTEILEHALELSTKDTDTNRRLALLATDNAVELTIKSYLSSPNRVTGINLSKKEYEEVSDSFPRLIETLERVSTAKAEGIDLAAIEWFHRLRNRLYHDGGDLTVARAQVLAYLELARLLYERLFETALIVSDKSPALVAQFVEAWVDLYKVLQRMVGSQLGEKFLQSTRSLNEKLKANGYLDDETISQIDEFRTIRNAVVHGDNDMLSAERVDILRHLSQRLKWQWETGRKDTNSSSHDKAGGLKPSFIDDLASKSWFHVKDSNGRKYILAMVNARGSCSMRTFDSQDGRFLGKRYKPGYYQRSFSTYLENAKQLSISRQPNLERDCRTVLPPDVLAEAQQQIMKGSDAIA